MGIQGASRSAHCTVGVQEPFGLARVGRSRCSQPRSATIAVDRPPVGGGSSRCNRRLQDMPGPGDWLPHYITRNMHLSRNPRVQWEPSQVRQHWPKPYQCRVGLSPTNRHADWDRPKARTSLAQLCAEVPLLLLDSCGVCFCAIPCPPGSQVSPSGFLLALSLLSPAISHFFRSPHRVLPCLVV